MTFVVGYKEWEQFQWGEKNVWRKITREAKRKLHLGGEEEILYHQMWYRIAESYNLCTCIENLKSQLTPFTMQTETPFPNCVILGNLKEVGETEREYFKSVEGEYEEGIENLPFEAEVEVASFNASLQCLRDEIHTQAKILYTLLKGAEETRAEERYLKYHPVVADAVGMQKSLLHAVLKLLHLYKLYQGKKEMRLVELSLLSLYKKGEILVKLACNLLLYAPGKPIEVTLKKMYHEVVGCRVVLEDTKQRVSMEFLMRQEKVCKVVEGVRKTIERWYQTSPLVEVEPQLAEYFYLTRIQTRKIAIKNILAKIKYNYVGDEKTFPNPYKEGLKVEPRKYLGKDSKKKKKKPWKKWWYT